MQAKKTTPVNALKQIMLNCDDAMADRICNWRRNEGITAVMSGSMGMTAENIAEMELFKLDVQRLRDLAVDTSLAVAQEAGFKGDKALWLHQWKTAEDECALTRKENLVPGATTMARFIDTFRRIFAFDAIVEHNELVFVQNSGQLRLAVAL
jgi:hypothetical protein